MARPAADWAGSALLGQRRRIGDNDVHRDTVRDAVFFFLSLPLFALTYFGAKLMSLSLRLEKVLCRLVYSGARRDELVEQFEQILQGSVDDGSNETTDPAPAPRGLRLVPPRPTERRRRPMRKAGD